MCSHTYLIGQHSVLSDDGTSTKLSQVHLFWTAVQFFLSRSPLHLHSLYVSTVVSLKWMRRSCVFPRTVVFTGLNTAYYSVLYHNHQNTNWENIFWKNCVCPSSRVPERMKSMTMLMLVFPFNLSLICIYATQTLCTFLSLKPPLVWHVSCTMFDSIPDHNSSWSPFWKLNKRALMHRY